MSAGINIEFLAGDDIGAACKEACALADRLGCRVVFKFNDVQCLVRPGDDADRLELSWRRALISQFTYKVASDRGAA